MTGSLAGITVVNTRARGQAQALSDMLLARAATVIPYPCITIAPPADTAKLDDALRTLGNGGFDVVVFTSSNAITAVADRMADAGLRVGSNPLRVAAIGPATAAAAKAAFGISAESLPEVYSAKSLAEHLQLPAKTRVFLPQSSIASHELAERLRSSGARVTDVVAYRTISGAGGKDLLPLLRGGEIDVITLTSGSTATGLCDRIRREGGQVADTAGARIACIGSETARVARGSGLHVDAIADPQNLDGLVSAVIGLVHDAPATATPGDRKP